MSLTEPIDKDQVERLRFIQKLLLRQNLSFKKVLFWFRLVRLEANPFDFNFVQQIHRELAFKASDRL
jgi:hypothetical protein